MASVNEIMEISNSILPGGQRLQDLDVDQMYEFAENSTDDQKEMLNNIITNDQYLQMFQQVLPPDVHNIIVKMRDPEYNVTEEDQEIMEIYMIK